LRTIFANKIRLWVEPADSRNFFDRADALRLAKQSDIVVAVDLPAFRDRAVRSLRPMKRHIAPICTATQSLNERFKILFAKPIHPSIPQHVIRVSIA